MDTVTFNDDLKYIYNIAYKLTQDKSDSEDLAQETLIIAWKKEASLKSVKARKGWLKKICINLFYMKKRKNKGYEEFSIDLMETFEDKRIQENTDVFIPLPEEELMTNEAIKTVRDNCFLGMTEKLTLNQRIIFMSVDIFGMTLFEASQIISISEAAAKAHLYRARKRLNQFFSEKCQWFHPDNYCRCEAYLDFHEDLRDKKKLLKVSDDYYSLKRYNARLKVNKEVSERIKLIYNNLPNHNPSGKWFDEMAELLNNRYA